MSAALPPTLEFLQQLWATVHSLERASKRMSSAIGLTGPQRIVLRIVGIRPGLSAGELAATMHVHPSTLTGVLRRLEGEGLLTREPVAHDRRRAVLQLSSRGARMNRTITGTVEHGVGRALRNLAPRDRRTALTLLASIAASVDREAVSRVRRQSPGKNRRPAR